MTRVGFKMEETQLIIRAQKGEKDAFRQLVENYQNSIFSLTYRMTGSPEEAKDLAQEAFIRIYTSISRFDTQGRFLSWALKITRNVCIDYLRKKRPVPVWIDESFKEPEAGKGPEEHLLAKEKGWKVRKAVMALKPEQREVIVLAHYHEMSYTDIARTLGITESIVRNRLYTARKRLAKLLAE